MKQKLPWVSEEIKETPPDAVHYKNYWLQPDALARLRDIEQFHHEHGDGRTYTPNWRERYKEETKKTRPSIQDKYEAVMKLLLQPDEPDSTVDDTAGKQASQETPTPNPSAEKSKENPYDQNVLF